MGSNSLLIVPSGFSPATSFAAYGSLGLTHTVGTTLTVPAGKGFSGSVSIGDPVVWYDALPLPEGRSISTAGLRPPGLVWSSWEAEHSPTTTLHRESAGGSLSVAYQYLGSAARALSRSPRASIRSADNLYAGHAHSAAAHTSSTAGSRPQARSTSGIRAQDKLPANQRTNSVSSLVIWQQLGGQKGSMALPAVASCRQAGSTLAIQVLEDSRSWAGPIAPTASLLVTE